MRGLSTALIVGMQLDGRWKLGKVFKLWISGVGLCLVIQWRLDCTALRVVWSCFGLVKPIRCSLRRGDATLWHL